MSNHINHKRVSLTQYWTSRYLLTLCIGLTIVAFLSAIWIRHTTLQNRLDMLQFMGEEITNRLEDNITNNSSTEPSRTPSGNKVDPGVFRERERFIDMGINPNIYIVDTEGNILSTNRPKEPMEQQTIPESVMASKKETIKFKSEDSMQTYYAIKKKIEIDDKTVGYIIITETKEHLTHLNQEYGQLAIMIVGLALLGLGAIYFLSRRLARPIKDVAYAAKQVQDGNYNIQLSDNIKEEEIYELVHSFKEMASRLEQLEAMRTELLAGVTHELKTPVTSISGLLQAIQDGVVEGEDQKEFIRMAVNETTKLKTMVGDLLAFNSFSVNAIPVKLEKLEINQTIQETVTQWELTQDTEDIELTLVTLPEPRQVEIDLVRFQQVFTNLFTNAKQAMKGHGKITVTLSEATGAVLIRVADTGGGILAEEQTLIFERFYRGENKKYEVHGLGLGLPLSKMMAQSIGGDLRLIKSSESGTIFEVMIPKL
ncbi:HAMP domain-containing sensor histidine kinase [Rummeliibacillus sp. SL167]|uniref:sensor histidine kinase n=1 Tax=Rummeliibacillus sp. SL167 TaxID=2579792 RepID=UPI0021031A9A|nr:HAMP domain-containing sensor histidine kinase [Rummeliibacillus sp. SL167]